MIRDILNRELASMSIGGTMKKIKLFSWLNGEHEIREGLLTNSSSKQLAQ
jgi:hypothetical protein